MLMPGRPKAPMGAEGQIDVPSPFEASESASDGYEDGDDRCDVPVGSQEMGPDVPQHGAAGGLDVAWGEVAPLTFTPGAGGSSMTTSHPAMGGAGKS